MNTLSKYFPLALLASLATACAGAPHVTTTAAGAAPRTCAGRTLNTDGELQQMAGCRAVRGDLTITGAVTTLEPLASVQSVSGTLSVESSKLDSLDGLDQLRTVRAITLKNNPELENLQGLESVRVLERLTVVKNGVYTLRGLKNLEKVGVLVLQSNRRLHDARSLSGVRDAEEVVLVDNSRLAGYSGILPNLQRRPNFATVSGNTLCALETAHLTGTPSAQAKARFSGIDSERAERLQARF